MKVHSKIIYLSFLFLMTIAFAILFIGDLSSLGTIIDAFSTFSPWSVIIGWFLEVIGAGFILFVLVKKIVDFFKDKMENNERKATSVNCFLLLIFSGVTLLGNLLTMIQTIVDDSNADIGEPIAIVLFLLLATIMFVLSITKVKNDAYYKVFASLGYLFLFIFMVKYSSLVATSIQAAFAAFMYFSLIVGIIQILLTNVNMEIVCKKKESTLPVEERLKTLKELREKDEITEEEYQEKRKEIIDSL